eukprot:355805-Chlamydomonas_euryale.AAC.3
MSKPSRFCSSSACQLPSDAPSWPSPLPPPSPPSSGLCSALSRGTRSNARCRHAAWRAPALPLTLSPVPAVRLLAAECEGAASPPPPPLPPRPPPRACEPSCLSGCASACGLACASCGTSSNSMRIAVGTSDIAMPTSITRCIVCRCHASEVAWNTAAATAGPRPC